MPKKVKNTVCISHHHHHAIDSLNIRRIYRRNKIKNKKQKTIKLKVKSISHPVVFFDYQY